MTKSRQDLEETIDNYSEKVRTQQKFKLLEKLYTKLKIVENHEFVESIPENSFDLDGDWSAHIQNENDLQDCLHRD